MPWRTRNYSRGTEQSEISEKLREFRNSARKPQQSAFVSGFFFFFSLKAGVRLSHSGDITAWKTALWTQNPVLLLWQCEYWATPSDSQFVPPWMGTALILHSSTAQDRGFSTCICSITKLCERFPHKYKIKLLLPGSDDIINNITVEKYTY